MRMDEKYIDRRVVEKTIDAFITNEIERRIKDYSFAVYRDGELVDSEDIQFTEGQVNIFI